IQRSRRVRKRLAVVCSVRCGDEWGREDRRSGTQVVVAERRNTIHDAARENWYGRIEHAITSPEAALPALPKDRLGDAFVKRRGVSDADRRRKGVPGR